MTEKVYKCSDARADIDAYFASTMHVPDLDAMIRASDHIGLKMLLDGSCTKQCLPCWTYYNMVQTRGGDRRAERARRTDERIAQADWWRHSSGMVAAFASDLTTDEDRVWFLLDHDHGHTHSGAGCCDWLVTQFVALLGQVRKEASR